jgi:hypothetical protein
VAAGRLRFLGSHLPDQESARPVQTGTNSPHGTTGDFSGLGVAHLLNFAKYDNLAIARGQSQDRLPHGRDALRTAQVFENAGVPVGMVRC